MKLGLITGNHPRHIAFANHVYNQTDVDAHVIVEREEMLPEAPENISPYLKALWDLHFARRDAAEANAFGDQTLEWEKPTHYLRITPGELNDLETYHWVRGVNLDAVLILGVPIIKDPLFSALPDWKVNLHMGLIPEYKGSITFFWPFYFLEPQMAGCTYHVIDKLVDTGDILHQVVPKIEKRGMTMHEVACQALLDAYRDVELVLQLLEDYVKVGEAPTPDLSLPRRGKLFKKADWHPSMLRVNYELYHDRMMDYYLEGQLTTTKKPNLISLAG